MTRICIFGAGAIGGYLAAALDKAGAAVSLVALGYENDSIGRQRRLPLPLSSLDDVSIWHRHM